MFIVDNDILGALWDRVMGNCGSPDSIVAYYSEYATDQQNFEASKELIVASLREGKNFQVR